MRAEGAALLLGGWVWERGLDWYASLFGGAGDTAAIGEGSTSYSMEALRPHTADRLTSTLPGARLIYIVRDPQLRARVLVRLEPDARLFLSRYGKPPDFWALQA